MCKSKAEGGPCAAHSRQKLAKAIKSKNADRILVARLQFELTSGGIKELRAQGNNFQADMRQAERDIITKIAILKKEKRPKKKKNLVWEIMTTRDYW